MKRLIFILAVFCGIGVALVLMRAGVSTETVATRLARVLVPFADREPDMSANVTVRLFPRLVVIFDHVRIAATQGATQDQPDFSADQITSDIDILPLLIGQTSVSHMVVEHPRLKIITPFSLEGSTPDRAVLARMLPASLTIHDGEILLQSPDNQHSDTLRGIEADLRWPRTLGNLSLDGSAIWHGEKLTLAIQGIAPPRLASGDTGDVEVTLDSPSLHLGFAGKATLSDKLQLEGVLDARTSDPGQLYDRLAAIPDSAASPQPAHALIDLSINGHMRSQGWTVTVPDARVKVGQAMADGSLSLRLDLPRPQVRGTLAIGDVNLTGVADALGQPEWLDWAPDPKALTALDIDLRLSIGEAAVRSARLSNVAASLLVSDGQVHADIGDASLLGGTGTVTLHGQVSEAGLNASGRVTLLGAPLQAVRTLFSLNGLPRATGAISWIGEFTTQGPTLASALSNLEGHAACSASQLLLEGFVGPVVSFASTRSALLQTSASRIGLNPDLEQVACNIRFSGSELTFDRLSFALGDLLFQLNGRASLGSRLLQVDGNAYPDPAKPKPARGEAVMAPDTVPDPKPYPEQPVAMMAPIHIKGTLEHPAATVGPDVPLNLTGHDPVPAATSRPIQPPN